VESHLHVAISPFEEKSHKGTPVDYNGVNEKNAKYNTNE